MQQERLALFIIRTQVASMFNFNLLLGLVQDLVGMLNLSLTQSPTNLCRNKMR
ncbi:hypothetical protein VMA_001403 [Vibrio mimicus VM223]|nr:hypothetical protein VMA_001403 [Vibrio mimicus VM223]